MSHMVHKPWEVRARGELSFLIPFTVLSGVMAKKGAAEGPEVLI